MVLLRVYERLYKEDGKRLTKQVMVRQRNGDLVDTAVPMDRVWYMDLTQTEERSMYTGQFAFESLLTGEAEKIPKDVLAAGEKKKEVVLAAIIEDAKKSLVDRPTKSPNG